MNYKFSFLLFVCILFSCIFCSAPKRKSIHLCVITGGHEFEKSEFWKAFDRLNGISYSKLTQPLDDNAYSSEMIKNANVLFFYDMWQDISDHQKEDFLNLLKDGKPMIFTHHSIASYQDWDEFKKIRGGIYNLEPVMKNGMKLAASTYKHDVDLEVKILDPRHPIVDGIDEFTIRDEAYGNLEILTEVHPVMGTDHPENSPLLAWTTQYEKSTIVYLQFGHDHFAYEDPNYRKILSNTIRWLAK